MIDESLLPQALMVYCPNAEFRTDGAAITFWAASNALPEPTEGQIIAAQEAIIAARAVKTWPDSGKFLEDWDNDERGALWNCEDSEIGGLAVLLFGWKGEVRADDPRIVYGMNAVVDAGILTTERRDAILGL